jgi:hypothetical protein
MTDSPLIHFVPSRKRTTLCGLPKPKTEHGYGWNVRWTNCPECLSVSRFKNGETIAQVARFLGWSSAQVEEAIRDYMKRARRC